MMLEVLANELLLDIFEYLDVVTLFRAFHNLNNRFNILLLAHDRDYHLDDRLVFRYQFNFSTKSFLSSIVEQIISLRLSYINNENFEEMDLFIFSGLDLTQLIYLRSISLCYINTKQRLHKIIIDCQNLPHLTYLKIIKCHSNFMNSLDFSNSIWSLSKLTHCCIDIQNSFCLPTVISLSLKYVSISCLDWPMSDIIPLYQHTPYLQSLDIPLNKLIDSYSGLLPLFLSITMLKLSNVQSSYVLTTMLKSLPNLTHLKVNTSYIDYDGYRWSRIINDFLSELKIFRLKMHIHFCDEKNTQERINQLIDSFRTRFWLEKHQWFIQCDYISKDNYTCILLHKLPYTFS